MLCTRTDLSENAECSVTELRQTHCVEGALDDWYHGVHVETRQHRR